MSKLTEDITELEENTGVIRMPDMLVQVLDKDMQVAEVDEKNAMEKYEQMLTNSVANRAEDPKNTADKEAKKKKEDLNDFSALHAFDDGSGETWQISNAKRQKQLNKKEGEAQSFGDLTVAIDAGPSNISATESVPEGAAYYTADGVSDGIDYGISYHTADGISDVIDVGSIYCHAGRPLALHL